MLGVSGAMWLGGSLLGGLLCYLVSLLKGYKEMSGRATLFAKSSEVLREEKRTLLENLDEGVITIDGRGRISYINIKAEGLLHVVSDNLLGHDFLEISLTKEGRLFVEAQKIVALSYEKKERVHSSLSVCEREKIYLNLVAIPFGNAKGAVLLIQDRSHQQKILDMGKEFIANASHELRTPVTIIRGFAETLHDLEEVSSEMYESILEKIIRNCERMEMLVKNLLMISGLDSMTKSNMRPCDLIPIIEESCQQCITAFPEIKIEQLTNADEIQILGDVGLLELAIFNILKNAVRYSTPPAHIIIKITATNHDVRVAIQDKGIGIAAEDLERIFDRFYTVDKARTRKLGGTGLGLSIVKVIIEKHDGQVFATSELGKGSTFHLKFMRI